MTAAAERQAWRDRAPVRRQISELQQHLVRAEQLVKRGDCDPSEANAIRAQIDALRA